MQLHQTWIAVAAFWTDGAVFDRDESLLDHIQCDSLSNYSLPGWDLVESNDYITIWTKPGTIGDSVRAIRVMIYGLQTISGYVKKKVEL